MPEVIPYNMIKPLLTLTDVTPAVPVDLQCFATNIAVEVDQDENETVTFCGSYTFYKPEKWTITVTVVQSFGADGFWTLVKPMVGHVVDFTILPDADAPVSVDNPEMSGQARVKAFPFLSGAPNETNEFDVELTVQGQPTWSTTPPAAMAAEPELEQTPA